MPLSLPPISFSQAEKIYDTLRGMATGAAIHVPAGAILGAVSTAVLSQNGFTPKQAAKIGAMGGAILGPLVHGVRGYFKKHFAPHKSVNHATLEVLTGLSIVVLQGVLGASLFGHQHNKAEVFSSFGATSFLVAGVALPILAVVKYYENSCCLMLGNSYESIPATEDPHAALHEVNPLQKV